jgi:glycosyltransferase involved in cell wall biosynthesis
MTHGLRVMHVVLSLAPGGTERLVVDLSRWTNGQVPTSVCCLDEAGAWASELRDAAIPVTVLGRQPGFHPTLGLRIAALAEQQRANVLHCHQYSPFVYGSIAGLRNPRLRIVFTEHGRLSDGPPSTKRLVVNRTLGRRPNRVVAVSHELRRYMVEEGFQASRVDVIHNGIDPGPEFTLEQRVRARVLLGLPDSALVIGTVARFDPVKRLDVLVEATAVVTRILPQAHLVMIGGGPEASRLEAQVADRGLTNRVVFTGPRHDVRTLMPAFDVYVNTSASEGISLTLLEAMAASRPVIATGVGGTPEILVEGTGVLVQPDDSRATAEVIVSVLRDPARGLSLGAAARSRVVEHFSFDRMARAYLAAYEG